MHIQNYKNLRISRKLALPIHQQTCNKIVFDLLSSYGLCSSYKICSQYETTLANTVIEQMKADGGLYIPEKLAKGIMTYFHLDNIDFSEATTYGSGTTHILNLAIFQPRMGKVTTIQLVCMYTVFPRKLADLRK